LDAVGELYRVRGVVGVVIAVVVIAAIVVTAGGNSS
jgi:hypothetical protein